MKHRVYMRYIMLQTSFKTSNQFSAHDNRDVLASDAEYFGVSHAYTESRDSRLFIGL